MNKAKNPNAVKLGRLSRGKPKTLSPEERTRRAATMKENQLKRWVKPDGQATPEPAQP